MEIELKFAIDPRDHGRLRRSQPLAGIRARRQVLDTIYFDTPDCQLASHDLALRLRHAGARWIEGLKSRQLGAGGLHVREEWEYERLDAGIELARFADTPLASLPNAATLHRRLEPAFRVVMDRTTWRISPAAGSRLEVALDHGEIVCGRLVQPLSEVEIECLEGDVEAAFALAERLLVEARLRPSPFSKAERGYRLFRRERPTPVKALPVRLGTDDTVAVAARRVLAAALQQLQGNEEGVLGSPDPEYLHQARIALRRLRSALRMFRKAIGAPRAGEWRSELGRTARRLGEARDWDVFATESLPPVLAKVGNAALARELRERVARRRETTRRRARLALRDARHRGTVLALTRWLAASERERSHPRLRDFAVRLLRQRHRRVHGALASLARMDAAERHRLRIDAKRLRYGTDALASLFEGDRVCEYLSLLSRLQDALGAANDAATALRLLDELRLPRRVAAPARARFAKLAASDPRSMAKLLRMLHTSRPWR